jgi:Flp pilus assembly protein TadG
LQLKQHRVIELRTHQMILSLMKRFFREQRGATAVAMAIMLVPIMIAASAAVDFSRIASARTLMQSSVDSAAIAGAGAYQLSDNLQEAKNVTTSAYGGSAAQLPSFVASPTSNVNVYCAASKQCGTTAVAAPANSGCPSNYQICVTVSSQGTLKNTLFAFAIPSELLSVNAVATTDYPIDIVDQGSFTHTSVGEGSDLSYIYAYSVPQDTNGNNLYSSVPNPNSSCSNSSFGPISDEPNLTPPSPRPRHVITSSSARRPEMQATARYPSSSQTLLPSASSPSLAPMQVQRILTLPVAGLPVRRRSPLAEPRGRFR